MIIVCIGGYGQLIISGWVMGIKRHARYLSVDVGLLQWR